MLSLSSRSYRAAILGWARTGLGPVALGARRFSPADQAAFAAFINHTTGRHVRTLAVAMSAVNLLYGFTDRWAFRAYPEALPTLFQVRALLCALCLAAWPASRLLPNHQRAVGMTFGPLCALATGYYMGLLGGPDAPWLHLQYFFVFGPVLTWLTPLQRALATAGWALGLVAGYFFLHPAHLHHPLAAMCFGYLLFIVLLSILAGTFTDLALVRMFALRLEVAAQAARHSERLHLARELHDELGQDLTALRYALKLTRGRVDREHPALRPNIDQLFGLLDHTGTTVRALLSDLRHQLPAGQRLSSAAAALVEAFRARTGLAPTLTVAPGVDEASEEIAAAALRVLREALTNVARHADASAVSVALQGDAAGVQLSIRDNGVGSAAPVAGFGLLGMREQAASVGGAVSLTSAPGAGTTVTLRVPAEGGA